MTRKWVSHSNASFSKGRTHRTSIFITCFLLSVIVQALADPIPSPDHPLSEQNSLQEVGEPSADKRASLSYVSSLDSFGPLDSSYTYSYLPTNDEEMFNSLRPNKRGMESGDMPGVLRFGKRAQAFIRFGRSAYGFGDDGARMLSKKEMPGVLRFGKRSDGQQEKKAVPGVLRFGKRDSDIPGVLRFGKRESDIPGVLRFGKRDIGDMPGVLRFGKRYSNEENFMPAGVLRFGKRDMPGVLRFGKKSDMPGVLRFGKRGGDMPGVLRFGKRSDVPGVLRFG